MLAADSNQERHSASTPREASAAAAGELRDRVIPPAKVKCSPGTLRRLARAGVILQTRGGGDEANER